MGDEVESEEWERRVGLRSGSTEWEWVIRVSVRSQSEDQVGVGDGIGGSAAVWVGMHEV